MKYIIIILLPFFGTTIGSFLVYFLKNKMNDNIKKIMLGSASGVMVAASIWSLLLPSIDLSNKYKPFDWFPASLGFLLGVLILITVDRIFYKIRNSKKNDKKSLMNLAITIHNIPEGMAVGVALASLILKNEQITYLNVLALSIGIAIQNIPEGAIVSLTLKAKKEKKTKAFLIGVLTGSVEPIAILITLFFSNFVSITLPYLLAFASGSMIYVVVEELLPDAHDENSKVSIISLTIGFIIMMILDVMLG